MSSSILLSIIMILLIMKNCCQTKNNNVTFDYPPSEKKALLKFKSSLLDDPSNYNRLLSSWKYNTECCSWAGVECDNATGHVVKLDLRNRVVNGIAYPILDSNLTSDAIGSSLLELKYLSYLDLSQNDFQHNSIPEFLGSMKHLKYLNLSNSQFEGIVPHQLGNLSSLRTLDLGGALDLGGEYENFLRVADATWAGNLLSLEYLDMSGVDLSTTKDLIKVLSKLPSLVDLRLAHSDLDVTHLPHANCVNRSTLLFTNVQYLDMSFNSIGENSSFCFLYNMTSLSFFDLSNNPLHEKADWIYDFLWDKCHLKLVNMVNNELYGDISGAFKNVSGCWGRNLESLDLGCNEFNGHLPEGLGELKPLTKLRVSYNNLSGPIPSSLGNLRALRVLDLRYNQLSGGIPVSLLGQLSNLESIDISHNKLSGPIPSSVGNLIYYYPQGVYHLDLSNNYIEGPIPSNIGHMMPFLQELYLSRNIINGPIPESLCQMKGLEFLDLSRNHLSGHLPNCNWGNLDYLKYAILSSNKLLGPIPNSIGGAYRLRWLQLSNNILTGKLPSTLRNCTLLYVLDVRDNMLSGNLPEGIGNHLLKLGFLIIRNNKFDGDIPSSYCQLSGLQIMDLAQNQLTGYIPHCLGSLSGMINDPRFDDDGIGDTSLSDEMMKGALQEYTMTLTGINLDLSSNRLFGKIPSELTNLNGLYGLNLSHNHLSGTIPRRIGDMSLGSFDLSSNSLSGKIPSELTNLNRLNDLNLSHNHLRGTIPRRIGDMKSLESFDLSSNSLSGKIPQSLSELTSLVFLNLSYNELSGPIPTAPRMQTFNNPSSYVGNPTLCGDPLPKKCHINNNGIIDKIYLCAFITGGVATGFWGYFGVLFFKRSWRKSLFRYMDGLIGKMLGRY